MPLQQAQWLAGEVHARRCGAVNAGIGNLAFLVPALQRWLCEVPRKSRKELTRFGAVRMGALPADVLLPCAHAGLSGTRYDDPGNWVYAQAFRVMFSCPPSDLAALSAESKGDLLEALLGAAYLILDEDHLDGVAPAAVATLRVVRREIERHVADALLWADA